jgi:hypothetical protein
MYIFKKKFMMALDIADFDQKIHGLIRPKKTDGKTSHPPMGVTKCANN